MAAYKLINQDNNKAGDHIVGRGEEQKVYKAGDVVESEEDLVAMFPGKFEHAPEGSKDSFETRKKPRSPITGLPSKRTPRPVGPEESGNTRAEILEVAEAIESGDHEVEQRADPRPPERERLRKGIAEVKKVAPIAKTARRGDVTIGEEEEEERPAKKGVGGTAPNASESPTPKKSSEEAPKKSSGEKTGDEAPKKKKKAKIKVSEG